MAFRGRSLGILTRVLVLVGVVAALSVPAVPLEASSLASVTGAGRGVEIHDAYAVVHGSQALGFFTIVNHTGRMDRLYGVLVGGLPAPLWHRHLVVTQSDLDALLPCGGDPRDAQPASSLHWGSVNIPAGSVVPLGPGEGQLSLGAVAPGSRSVPVQFDFDYAGSVVLDLPVRRA